MLYSRRTDASPRQSGMPAVSHSASLPAISTTLPRWARWIDITCLGLVVIASIVFQWGGFRERFGDVRIALTSADRPLLLAAVLLLVRHAIVRRPTVVGHLWSYVRRARGSADTRAASAVLIATRPAILFIGFYAVMTFGFNEARPPLRFSDQEFLNLQSRWDATWYMSVAVDGYRYYPDEPNRQQNVVFFPALPMATRVIGRLAGGSAPAFLWGGSILVIGAFFWALVYVFRLARDLLGDDGRAWWTVWFVAAYPWAVFYSALYTESFFLLGAAGAIWHFRRRELVKAGAWGLLVGLTRPNGCFLSIVLGLMAIWPRLPQWLMAGPVDARDRDPSLGTAPAIAAALLSASMSGIGVLLYSAFMWRLTGRPLIWAELHLAWGREYNGLVPLVSMYAGKFLEDGAYEVTRALPFEILNAIGAGFVIATAIPVWRRFGLPYAVFILINILPPLAAGGFLSTGRFSAVLFPAFVWLAAVVPVSHRPGWIGGFMAGQAFMATLFYTWRHMF